LRTESFRPFANTAPVTALGKTKFYGRMLFDLQVWTVYRDLRRNLPQFEGHVLDVGCGGSPYRFLLERSTTEYVGIDITDAQKFDYANPEIVPFDGRHIPFPDGRFNAVICTEVLEHVEHYQELVDEMYRVLEDGGAAIITVPWSARYHYIPYDYFRFTPSSLRTIFGRFREVTINPRGTDMSVIASKFVALWFRNMFPLDRRKRALVPLWILGSPLLGLVLALGHASARIGRGSADDPLGYTIIVKK
jgi:ubiquinone/menaquinone biosynthesis C-methylase UbiE